MSRAVRVLRRSLRTVRPLTRRSEMQAKHQRQPCRASTGLAHCCCPGAAEAARISGVVACALIESAVVASALQRVAVFCGSSAGTNPNLSRYSYEVGRGLADRGIGLVYGAGGFGLMRDVSQGALDAGGEVIGVIPRSMLEREWGRADLTELHLVETMHERKAMMAEHADAFLCLPGGLGTLDEIMEVWSWRQVGFNDHPVGFLNVDGFWAPLLGALDGLVDAGFVRREVMDDLVVADNLDDALTGLANRAGAGPRK